MQANPLLQSWDLRTPLHVAAQHRQPAVIREILLDPQVRRQLAGNPSQSVNNTPARGMPVSSSKTDSITQPSSYMHLNTDHQDSQRAQQQLGIGTNGQTEHMPVADMVDDKDNAQLQAAVEGLHSLRSAHLHFAMSSRSEAAPEKSVMHAHLQSDISKQAATAMPNAMHEADAGSHEAEASSMGGGEEIDDTDALDALMLLTADCSMQSPRKATVLSLPATGELLS